MKQGGLARTATAVKEIKQTHDNVLIIDAGNFSAMEGMYSEVLTTTTLQIMQKIGYDAVNINNMDVFHAEKVMETLPFVSANIMYKASGEYVAAPFQIQTKGDVTVGITGISPGPGTYGFTFNRSYRVVPPLEALEKILPEMTSKADLIILLSQYSSAETKVIMDAVNGIDIALTESPTPEIQESNKSGTDILEVGKFCSSLDYATLSVSSNGGIETLETNHIKLDRSVYKDPQIETLTQQYKIEEKMAAIKEQAEKQKADEIKQLHKLSPMEYTQMMLEQQKEQKEEKAE